MAPDNVDVGDYTAEGCKALYRHPHGAYFRQQVFLQPLLRLETESFLRPRYCIASLRHYSLLISRQHNLSPYYKQVRVIPLRHKCIFKSPVVDGEIDFLMFENLSWKQALEKHRQLHQLHV